MGVVVVGGEAEGEGAAFPTRLIRRMVRLSFMDIFQRAPPVKQSTGIPALRGPLLCDHCVVCRGMWSWSWGVKWINYL